jgi:hypothetical protein
MKILSLVFVLFISQITSAQVSDFQYLSPKPNSILNSKETNIIIRQGEEIDLSTISKSLISVTGSQSGKHDGRLILSDDNKTIVFNPSTYYTPNENVNVRLNSGIKTVNGKDIGIVEFSFKVSPLKEPIDVTALIFPEESSGNESALYKNLSVQADTLPADFPVVTVDSVNNPYEGKIFIANKPAGGGHPYGYYVMIVDTGGTVLKHKKFNVAESNFKILPNGLLAVSDAARHFVMDTSLAILDTFRCGNGYRTDVHDFQLLPNGHAIVFGTDPQPVDMSLIVPGGRPDAVLTGNVIQELDADRNVIFQWRTWDYIPITSSYYDDLTAKNIDYAHVNSHEVDVDGNLIVTMRYMSNVVKIDRKTGDVLWILGGKDNQFSFLDEHESNAPEYFSLPHNATILPNGNLTLFDNGDHHTPPYSRGVEYEIDQENKTVRLVWEFRHDPDIYASSGGNVQRLPNGNTIICWGRGGASDSMPVFTEVHPDGSIASELFYPDGMFSYRAYKFPMGDQVPSPEDIFYDVLQGNTYPSGIDTSTTGVSITFDSLAHDMYANAIVRKYNYSPTDPVFIEDAPLMAAAYFTIQGELITYYSGEVHVDLDKYPQITKPESTVVYVRPLYGEVFIARPTSYDSLNNELVFTTTDFGEFAFGVPQEITVNPPFPLLPVNNKIVNGESSVRLFWGTRGIVQTYNLRVASDSAFSNLVIDTSGLTSPSFTLNSVNNDTAYFWRVSTTNSAGTSGWSETFKFLTASPFIDITYPNGGESVYRDSIYIIRWESNVNDTLNIMLVKTNGEIIYLIADTITAATNAIRWQVPSDLQADTSYKISIVSLPHTGLGDSSDNAFSVIEPVGVSGPKNVITSYSLSQNYPNPFNPVTRIDYYIPKNSFVSLKIYDFLGNEIKTLVSEERPAGKYSAVWDGTNNRKEKVVSSVYFYSLETNSGRITRKMILLK